MFFLFLLLCVLNFEHPLHLGITQVDYSVKEHSLQISHRFFVDDFTQAVKKYQKDKPSENTIKTYIESRFFVFVDEKSIKLDFVGYEYEDELIWIYQEYYLDEFNSLEIQNDVLFGMYEDQRNMIHFKYKAQKESYILDKGNNLFHIDLVH